MDEVFDVQFHFRWLQISRSTDCSAIVITLIIVYQIVAIGGGNEHQLTNQSAKTMKKVLHANNHGGSSQADTEATTWYCCTSQT